MADIKQIQTPDGTLHDLRDASVLDQILGIANPNKSITFNSDHLLEVGGRIGQFAETTGLFAPDNREPRYVNDYSLLLTDALGMDMQANRALAIISGMSITVRSAEPNTTVYYAENTYNNRILAKVCEGGYVSKDEATSKVEMTIPVESVLINGATFYPDSSPDDPNNPIVITLAETANPDTTITQLRMFGTMTSYASAHIGNGVTSLGSGGRSLMLGGGITKNGGNDHCMVGQYLYATGNGNTLLGRYIIARKNRGFFTGTGHDGTNARAEAVAVMGQYSLITPKTLFALGNGTNATNRSNAFEIAENDTKISNIVATAKQIEFDYGDYDNLAPALVASNWGANANWSFADEVLTINSTASALNCTAVKAKFMPVTEGETLTVSLDVKKANADGTIGNLQVIMLKTNAEGTTQTGTYTVVTKTSADFTTDWVTVTATWTVPSGVEYFLPRITRVKGTASTGQNYQIRNLVIGRPMDKGIIMHSPNGTRYKLVVDDTGNISTVAV